MALAACLAPGLVHAADIKEEPVAAPDGRRNIPQGEGAYPAWETQVNPEIRRTDLDWAGSYNKYYGQTRNQYRDKERMIAKVDLDGDFNYDGIIDNEDPGDNGEFQQIPPGLVVGVGELTQVVLRIRPYRVDFYGDAVVALELDSINRGDRSGKYSSFDEELANSSHVRVWRDARRTQLLLDSRDPNMRRCEWTIENWKAMGGAVTGANLPYQTYPRAVYVEGLKPHGPYLGDIRLLVLVENRRKGAVEPSTSSTTVTEGGKQVVVETTTVDPVAERSTRWSRFRSSWDHILLTVVPDPVGKELAGRPGEVWR